MNGRIGLIIGALLLAAVSGAEAQRINTPYRFFEETQAAGIFVMPISPDKGAIGLGPDKGTAFGARYHIRMSGPFFIEGELLYFPTTRAVLDTAVVDSAFERVGEAKTAIALGQASLRFNITGQRTWNRLLPFVLLGVGIAAEVRDDDAAEEDVASEARFDFGTTFAGQIGAGIEFFPVDRLAVRIDARNLLWQLKTPEGLAARGSLVGRTLAENEWANNLAASIGVSIHF